MTESPRRGPGCLVVGYDGSPGSEAALRWALEEGRRSGRTVELVTVWSGDVPVSTLVGPVAQEIQARAELFVSRTLEDLAGREPGVVVAGEAVEGRTAETLIRESRHADMLVLGTRGHGGFTGLLLGSVAQQCVRHAHCPVLIVPPERRRRDVPDAVAVSTATG